MKEQRINEPKDLSEHDELVQEYNSLVANIELQVVNLLSSRSVVTEANEGEQPDSVIIAPPGFRWRFSEDDRILQCGVKFEVRAIAPTDYGPLAVDVIVEYVLLYGLSNGDGTPTDQVAEKFAERNAVFNAWPFFREFAHSQVSRMGLPQIVIPLYRL